MNKGPCLRSQCTCKVVSIELIQGREQQSMVCMNVGAKVHIYLRSLSPEPPVEPSTTAQPLSPSEHAVPGKTFGKGTTIGRVKMGVAFENRQLRNSGWP